MKRLLATLGFLLAFASPALASNCPTFTYTLTNGQTADANQVMANFNTLLTCSNNSLAHNAANSDITSLSALTGLSLPGSALAGATFHIFAGTAPTSPIDGDIWTTTTAMYVQINSATLRLMAGSNNLSEITSAATARTNIGVTATGGDTTYAFRANNLSDLASAATARTNLGVTATGGDTTYAFRANNLSDLASAATARTNLGVPLGTSGATLCLENTSCTWASQALASGSTVNSSLIVTTNDSRFGGPTQNGQCTYGLLIADAGAQIYCNTAGTHTLTIPANASVAFNVGTKIDVVNDCTAGNMTIAITTDTMVWFPGSNTGSRTLGACGEATLTKVSSTRWAIVGVNLS